MRVHLRMGRIDGSPGKHGPGKQRAGRHDTHHGDTNLAEPFRQARSETTWNQHTRLRRRGRRHTLLIAARVGLLAAALAGCGAAGLSKHVGNPQVFEAESLDAALGAGWTTQPDPDASGDMAIVAAPSAASDQPAATFDLPFVLGAADAGTTTVHLRLWAPASTETSVTLGFDGDIRSVPVTGSGRYAWIAAPSAILDAGPHAVTLTAPPQGVRYDLFVVAQGQLTDGQLDALADLPTAPPPPGSQPTEPVFPTDKAYPDRQAGLYGATLEWSARAPKVTGNPFDVDAGATFVNQAGGNSIKTDLYYDGDGVYRFRFAPTELGRWTFEVRSDRDELNGLKGTVTVVPNDTAGARGFYQAVDGKIAVPVGNDSRLHGVPYQIYMRGNGGLESIDRLPKDPARLSKALDAALDEAEGAGFSAVFVGVWDNWFSLGDPTWKDHDSVNPDPATFRLLETLIERAHARGMGVHIWAWGDNQLKTTQIGVKGGIGGAADRRLQRYIAARLGPIPGWTMAYGFDLHEWVTPDQVRAWAKAINGRSGWPHLLTARQQSLRDMSFFLGRDQLPLVSNDIRTDPTGYRPYHDALDAFKAADGKPVLFERRFLFGRDSVWTMDATRRAMWQITMAGGAASFWGIGWDDPPVLYTKPGQLRAFQEFWRTRLDVDLSPREGANGTLLLTSPDGSRVVAYGQTTNTLSVPVTGGGRAIAIDTKAETYEEMALDPPAKAGTWTWTAPRKGDWAIAFSAR